MYIVVYDHALPLKPLQQGPRAHENVEHSKPGEMLYIEIEAV